MNMWGAAGPKARVSVQLGGDLEGQIALERMSLGMPAVDPVWLELLRQGLANEARMLNTT